MQIWPDELSVPGEAKAPTFPEILRVFLVPREDENMGGDRSGDLHRLPLY